MLAEAECDFIQGYYLSKPQKADDLQEWILGGAKLEFAPVTDDPGLRGCGAHAHVEVRLTLSLRPADSGRAHRPGARRRPNWARAPDGDRPQRAQRSDPPTRRAPRPEHLPRHGAVRRRDSAGHGHRRPAAAARGPPPRPARPTRAPSPRSSAAGPALRHAGPPGDGGPDRRQPLHVARRPAEHPERPPQRPADLQRRLRRPLRAGRRRFGLRLRHQHDRVGLRTGGTHPRPRHHPRHGLRRPLPGRCPADPADVDGGGIPVGTVGLGPPGRDVRHVLLDAGDPAARLRLQATTPGCVQTTHGANTAMCISRATSTSPSGPFVDDSSSAFICPTARAGRSTPASSSPRTARPGSCGRATATAATCRRTSTPSSSQPDGLSTVGPPHELIGATQAWEGGLVEAPSMVQSGSTFWMFYSANLWGTPNYSIGIANCPSVTGPCTKPLDQAWHTSTNQANGQGYGGSEFFEAGGGLVWMVHHGLVPGQSGDYAERRLYVDLMVFPKKGLPKIAPRGRPQRRWPWRRSTTRTRPPLAAPGRLPPPGHRSYRAPSRASAIRRRSATASWPARTSPSRRAMRRIATFTRPSAT